MEIAMGSKTVRLGCANTFSHQASVKLCGYFLIFAVLLLASCADMFQPKIAHPGKNGNLDGLFVTNVDISKLERPGQFYVAPYYSSSEVRLTWTAVRGAAYYMVERAPAFPVPDTNLWQEPDEGDYEPLERFIYSTSFTDTVLKSAALDSPEYQNRYFYRVSAFNTAKKYEESEPTEPQSSMLFRAPSGLRASGGTSVEYVELRWDRSAGAEAYEILRSDFPNGASATSLGTVRGNQIWFQNRVSAAEQGKDFYYMVTAVNNFGNKSLWTKPAYGYARVHGAPDAPANVRLETDSGRGHSKSEIKIKWDTSEGIDVYYSVYRYSSVDSSLTRLTDKTENTNWTDTQGLRPGVYYYYKIQAIVDDIKSGKALKSQFSDDDRAESYILSCPGPGENTVIAEKNPDGTVTVKWRPAIGSEVERMRYSYNVYADSSIDGSFSKQVALNIGWSTGADGYIHSGKLSGADTFFRVSTVFNFNESEKSVVVSPSPAAADIVEVTQRAFISANESANSSGVYPVRITWKKPANETPAFYHVQRSTRKGSGYSKINGAALDARGTGTDGFSYDPVTGIYTYIDRNDTARVGRKYWYRVLSLNQLEQGSFPSDERIGWGALSHQQYILEYNKTMKSALKKLTYMHKPGSTEKLGKETKYGAISGDIYYDAAISGLGARIIIKLTNYADFYIENEPDNGVYFVLNGNSNTSANMSSNGDMDGTMNCTGMYPGRVWYDKIQIKGGAAGGGTYGVQPDGFTRMELPFSVLD
jgi:hypothetical protein